MSNFKELHERRKSKIKAVKAKEGVLLEITDPSQLEGFNSVFDEQVSTMGDSKKRKLESAKEEMERIVRGGGSFKLYSDGTFDVNGGKDKTAEYGLTKGGFEPSGRLFNSRGRNKESEFLGMLAKASQGNPDLFKGSASTVQATNDLTTPKSDVPVVAETPTVTEPVGDTLANYRNKYAEETGVTWESLVAKGKGAKNASERRNYVYNFYNSLADKKVNDENWDYSSLGSYFPKDRYLDLKYRNNISNSYRSLGFNYPSSTTKANNWNDVSSRKPGVQTNNTAVTPSTGTPSTGGSGQPNFVLQSSANPPLDVNSIPLPKTSKDKTPFTDESWLIKPFQPSQSNNLYLPEEKIFAERALGLRDLSFADLDKLEPSTYFGIPSLKDNPFPKKISEVKDDKALSYREKAQLTRDLQKKSIEWLNAKKAKDLKGWQRIEQAKNQRSQFEKQERLKSIALKKEKQAKERERNLQRYSDGIVYKKGGILKAFNGIGLGGVDFTELNKLNSTFENIQNVTTPLDRATNLSNIQKNKRATNLSNIQKNKRTAFLNNAGTPQGKGVYNTSGGKNNGIPTRFKRNTSTGDDSYGTSGNTTGTQGGASGMSNPNGIARAAATSMLNRMILSDKVQVANPYSRDVTTAVGSIQSIPDVARRTFSNRMASNVRSASAPKSADGQMELVRGNLALEQGRKGEEHLAGLDVEAKTKSKYDVMERLASNKMRQSEMNMRRDEFENKRKLSDKEGEMQKITGTVSPYMTKWAEDEARAKQLSTSIAGYDQMASQGALSQSEQNLKSTANEQYNTALTKINADRKAKGLDPLSLSDDWATLSQDPTMKRISDFYEAEKQNLDKTGINFSRNAMIGAYNYKPTGPLSVESIENYGKRFSTFQKKGGVLSKKDSSEKIILEHLKRKDKLLKPTKRDTAFIKILMEVDNDDKNRVLKQFNNLAKRVALTHKAISLDI